VFSNETQHQSNLEANKNQTRINNKDDGGGDIRIKETILKALLRKITGLRNAKKQSESVP
jgi:hypothetical protein